jgi:RNA polymerase sigma-70 factor (ECF subfamily)
MADTPRETALPLNTVAGARNASSDASRESEVISLFDLLRVPLLRYLMSLGLAVADGEEIVQEVFLALFEHLGRGGSRENLRGWLFRVAHNLGLKRARRARRWESAEEAEPVADSAPNPEQQAAYSERQRLFVSILRALPEQDRQCLSLRAEGLRYREIAEVLGISLGSVSISIARSVARFSRAAGDSR